MSYHYGFLVETMVSVLLLLTILYCVRLNKQLRLLKADEQSLRATISELVTATEIADRAIGGLKATMQQGEQAWASDWIAAKCSRRNSICISRRVINCWPGSCASPAFRGRPVTRRRCKMPTR